MNRLLASAGAVMLALSLAPTDAAAQASPQGAGGQSNAERARERGAEPVCAVQMRDDAGNVVAADETREASGMVMAVCNGRGFVLGRGDGFVMMPHRDTGAVAVVVGRDNDRKVWLLSPDEEGNVMLEDLTYEFARAVGRSPTGGLADVRINLARFRNTGVIGAEPEGELPDGAQAQRGASGEAIARRGRPDARPARAAEIALERRLMRGRPAAATGSEGAQ